MSKLKKQQLKEQLASILSDDERKLLIQLKEIYKTKLYNIEKELQRLEK